MSEKLITRREVLKSAGLAALSIALAGCGGVRQEVPTSKKDIVRAILNSDLPDKEKAKLIEQLLNPQTSAAVTPQPGGGEGQATPTPTTSPTPEPARPTPTTSPTPEPGGGEGQATPTPTSLMERKEAVTVEQALRAAAENYARKTNGDPEQLYRLISNIYYSLPEMPFVAPGTQGLIPDETQATSMPIPPSKDPNHPSFYGQASMRGFYAFSGGYVFANVGGYRLEKPWEDKTTQMVYFIGSTTRNTPIGFYDYAPGGSFATGASYGVDQEGQFPERRMIDRVWVADGVMQAALRDGLGGKTVVSFVDTTTGEVSEYTYQIPEDIAGGNWTSRTYQLPQK